MKGRTMVEWNNDKCNAWWLGVHTPGSFPECPTGKGVHTYYSLDGDFHGDRVVCVE